MRVLVEHSAWERGYALRMATDPHDRFAAAVGVSDDGHVIYRVQEPGAEVRPFLRFTFDEWEAIARAVGEITQASDATTAALADTREVRDRLLTLVERSIG